MLARRTRAARQRLKEHERRLHDRGIPARLTPRTLRDALKLAGRVFLDGDPTKAANNITAHHLTRLARRVKENGRLRRLSANIRRRRRAAANKPTRIGNLILGPRRNNKGDGSMLL